MRFGRLLAEGVWRRPLLAAALLASVAPLQGCSWVPDWANPVQWYDDVVGGGESSPSKSAEAPPPTVAAEAEKQTESKEFPKLSSVPSRPEESSSSERKQVREGLIADRESARYTDEQLRGGASPGSEAPPPTRTAETAKPAAPEPAPKPAAPEPAPKPAAEQETSGPATAAAASASPSPSSASPPPAPPSTAAAAPAPAPPPAPRPAPMPTPSPKAAAPAPAPPPSMPRPAMPAPASTRPPAASIEEVYRAALAQSAATVTTAPANPQFNPPRGQAVQHFTTDVPPIVQQTYNAAMQQSAPPPISYYPGFIPPGLPTAGRAAASGATPAPTAAQQAAFAGAGSIRVATILFPNGSAHLTPKDRREMSEVVAARNTRGGIIRVIGYASSRTRDMSVERHKLVNFDISQRRAEAVARELIREGARPEDVFVEARSDTAPVYAEAMPSAERSNRRVEIFLEN